MDLDRKCLDDGRSCRPGRCPSRVWITVTPALRAAASTFLRTQGGSCRAIKHVRSRYCCVYVQLREGDSLNMYNRSLESAEVVAHHIYVAALTHEVHLSRGSKSSCIGSSAPRCAL